MDDDTVFKILKGVGYSMLALLIVGLVILIVAVCGGIHATYSQGERAGVVTKWSEKGWVCKTWEGEMNLGGVRGGDDSGKFTPNTWEFSDPNGDFKDQISEFCRSGTPCVIHYKQVWQRGLFNADTDYVVVSVEPLNK